jgi:hypothetical protein
MFGEWYQKTNKTGDGTNKLTLLTFKIIASRTAAIQQRLTAVL